MGITQIDSVSGEDNRRHGRERGRRSEVEELRARIGELVRERQDLRTDGAPRASLERNRIRLARSHSELSRALIACHLVA
jgi:hypothetical protein